MDQKTGMSLTGLKSKCQQGSFLSKSSWELFFDLFWRLPAFFDSWLPLVQFSSVFQSCPTFCNLMDCSTPGFPVHHQLLEVTQMYVHWVGDATQSSHPVLSPSPDFNHSQHQDLFKWVSSSHQWPKYWSFSFSISPSHEYSRLMPPSFIFKTCNSEFSSYIIVIWPPLLPPSSTFKYSWTIRAYLHNAI